MVCLLDALLLIQVRYPWALSWVPLNFRPTQNLPINFGYGLWNKKSSENSRLTLYVPNEISRHEPLVRDLALSHNRLFRIRLTGQPISSVDTISFRNVYSYLPRRLRHIWPRDRPLINQWRILSYHHSTWVNNPVWRSATSGYRPESLKKPLWEYFSYQILSYKMLK